MSDIVSLGFSFKTDGAERKIKNIIDLFEKLEAASQKTKANFGNIFKGTLIYDATMSAASIKSLNQNIRNLHEISKKINLTKVSKELKKLELHNIKPIPKATLDSIKQLNLLIFGLNNNLKNLQKNKKHITDLSLEIKNVDSVTSHVGLSLERFFKNFISVSAFKQATEAAARFGYELSHISSIATELNSTYIRKGLLNVSSEYGSSTRLAEGLYYAYSSGIRGSEKDYIKFTERMGKLSALIRSDITPTINAATSITNAYNVETSKSAEIVDLFYGIVKQGKASGEQLASAIGQVIPTAATAGVSLNELGAAISSLTKVMNTRVAVTALNNMLNKMLKPTKESILAAKKYGIELGLAEINAKGFTNKLTEIVEKTNGSRDALLRIFPDIRGMRSALHLLQNGWEDYNKQLEFFNNKSGIADEAMKILNKDLNYQVSVIPNTLEKLKIATGDSILHIFTFGGTLTPVLASINNMSVSMQKFLGSVVSIGVAFYALRAVLLAVNATRAASIKINSVLATQQAGEIKRLKLLQKINASFSWGAFGATLLGFGIFTQIVDAIKEGIDSWDKTLVKLKEKKDERESQVKEIAKIFEEIDFSNLKSVFKKTNVRNFDNITTNFNAMVSSYMAFSEIYKKTGNVKNLIGNIKYYEKQLEQAIAFDDRKNVKKIDKNLDVWVKNAAMLAENMKEANKKLVDTYNLLGENLESTYSVLNDFYKKINEIKYNTLTSEQKNKKAQKDLIDLRKQFYKGLENRDVDVVKNAFQNMVKAHNMIVSDAKKAIQESQSIVDSMVGKRFNILERLYQNDPAKLRKLSSEYVKRFTEATDLSDLYRSLAYGHNSFISILKSGVDAKQAFDGIEQASNLYINAIKLEEKLKKDSADKNKQLAKSMLDANNNTLKMIQSMDKYSTNVINAVDAYSVAGFELMNRSYIGNIAMPSIKDLYKPETEDTNPARKSEEQIILLMNNLASLSEKIRKEAEGNIQEQKFILEKREAELKKDAEATDKFFNDWSEKISNIAGTMNAIKEVLSKSQADISEIKSVEKSVGEINKSVGYIKGIGENVKTISDKMPKIVGYNTPR